MADRWDWGGPRPAGGVYLGRRCFSFTDAYQLAELSDVLLRDGWVEIDLAVERARAFHGVFWRRTGELQYESFFLRPHQVGNPDAIQYTPVWNGMSAWQLYHGEGEWNESTFPLDEWFTVRVEFTDDAADVYVAALEAPALEVRPLLGPQSAGSLGVLVGGPGLHLADLRHGNERRALPPRERAVEPNRLAHWEGSEPLGEAEIPDLLDTKNLRFTQAEAEPSGLVNLSRVHAIEEGRNTVYARTTISSQTARRAPLDIGFSDRIVVFLNGERIYRGSDAYRSRDYRFLGSIGWYDTVYLALRPGDNELVAAVSEDFGGWGIQARL